MDGLDAVCSETVRSRPGGVSERPPTPAAVAAAARDAQNPSSGMFTDTVLSVALTVAISCFAPDFDYCFPFPFLFL